jgi:hypothetical protein
LEHVSEAFAGLLGEAEAPAVDAADQMSDTRVWSSALLGAAFALGQQGERISNDLRFRATRSLGDAAHEAFGLRWQA